MRTEEEVLKDFEKLGYKINKNYSNYFIWLDIEDEKDILRIDIEKIPFSYCKFDIRKKDCHERPIIINMHEHKLLHELFEIWGWLE